MKEAAPRSGRFEFEGVPQDLGMTYQDCPISQVTFSEGVMLQVCPSCEAKIEIAKIEPIAEYTARKFNGYGHYLRRDTHSVYICPKCQAKFRKFLDGTPRDTL